MIFPGLPALSDCFINKAPCIFPGSFGHFDGAGSGRILRGMEDIFTTNLGPATIKWERTRMGSDMLNTWHARLEAPARSENFAYVAKDIHGRWFASVSPRGYMAKPTFYACYASPEKAVAQVERWTRVHWRRLPIQAPQPGWTGRPRG